MDAAVIVQDAFDHPVLDPKPMGRADRSCGAIWMNHRLTCYCGLQILPINPIAIVRFRSCRRRQCRTLSGSSVGRKGPRSDRPAPIRRTEGIDADSTVSKQTSSGSCSRERRLRITLVALRAKSITNRAEMLESLRQLVRTSIQFQIDAPCDNEHGCGGSALGIFIRTALLAGPGVARIGFFARVERIVRYNNGRGISFALLEIRRYENEEDHVRRSAAA